MQSKVIVFDVDDTLFDTKAGIIVTKAGIIVTIDDVLRKYKKEPIGEDADKYIGQPIKETLIKYKGFIKKEAVEATSMYRRIYVDKYIGMSELYYGMEDSLKILIKDGHILCVAIMKKKATALVNYEISERSGINAKLGRSFR